jgi:hypothetical protein
MQTDAPPPPASAEGPTPASGARGPAWPTTTAWILGVVAALGLLATSVLSVGLAAILCAPLLLLLGGLGGSVWAARRRRQALENRSSDEIKDPLHAVPPWPTEGVIDDRLPEP